MATAQKRCFLPVGFMGRVGVSFPIVQVVGPFPHTVNGAIQPPIIQLV